MGRGRVKPRGRSQQAFDEHQYRDIGQRVSTAVQSALASSSNRVLLPSDVAITSAAWVSLTGAEFPVLAGQLYHFYARIFFTSSSTSAGSAWAITGPAAPTYVAYMVYFPASAGTGEIRAGDGYDDTLATSSSTGTTTGNLAILDGLIMPSIDGTVTLRGFGESTFTHTAKAAGATYLEYWQVS